MFSTLIPYAYLASAVLFILALRGLSSPETAQQGNKFGMIGMTIAIITTLLQPSVSSYGLIILAIAAGGAIGTFIAKKIEMTALPQLVAAFHSLVGLAAVFVGMAAFFTPEAFGLVHEGIIQSSSLIEIGLGVAIGAITFTGSLIAFAKLQGIIGGKPLVFPMQHQVNLCLGILTLLLVAGLVLTQAPMTLWLIVGITMLLGFLLILPIGGADMPVVVSMLNSYSGWAAAATGFTLQNPLLIIVGAVVGASGAILSYIMCKGMNRSIFNVILGGFGADSDSPAAAGVVDDRPVKSGSAEDAAFIMKNASSVIIVPGYGMAVAQAQHVLREMADLLKKNDVKVRYAIHPVAGRM
ncbi:MAG: NAD(P)(+) transhydrogenase (Re/Si-specific) subunit beta, partial [Bdellovibrionales bacterium]